MERKDHDHLQGLLSIEKRNLQELETQKARYGPGEAPLLLLNKIEDIKEEIADLEARLQSTSGLSSRGQTIYSTNVPYVSDFVKREKDLASLRQLFRHNNLLAIIGIAGIGKTYLAAHFAEEIGNGYRVLWLTVEKGLTLEGLFAALAELTSSYGDQTISQIALDARPAKEKTRDLIGALSRHKVALFLDNYELVSDEAIFHLMAEIRFHLRGSKVVLISAGRVSKSDLLIPEMRLHSWDEETSLTYLRNNLVNLRGLGFALPDDGSLRQIHELCDGYPQSIRIVLGLLLTERRYDDFFQKRDELLEERYKSLSKDEWEVLTLCSLLAQPITRQGLEQVCPLDTMQSIIRQLQRKLLLRWDDAKDAFYIESLLKSFFRDRAADTDKERYHQRIGDYYYGLLKSSNWSDVESAIQAYVHLFLAGQHEGKQAAVLMEISHHLVRMGQLEQLEEAEKLIDTLYPGRERFYLMMSEVYTETGRWEKAEQNLQTCLELSKQKKNENQRAIAMGKSYTQLALLHQFRGDFEQETAYCEKALACYDQAGQPAAKIATWILISDKHRMRGEYASALEQLSNAEISWQELSGKDDGDDEERLRQKARAFLSRGFIHNNLGRDQGDADLQMAGELFEKVGDEQGRAIVLIYQGNSRLERGEPGAAAEMFLKALDIARLYKNRQAECYALNELATARRQQGEYEKALKLCVDSLTGKIELGDRHGVADTMMNLTPITYTHPVDGSTAAALVSLLQKVGSRFSDLLSDVNRWRLQSLNTLAEADDLPLLLSNCAIEMFQSLSAKFYLAKALLEQARLYLARGEHERAAARIAQVHFDYAYPYGYTILDAQALAMLVDIPEAVWVWVDDKADTICFTNKSLWITAHRHTGLVDLADYETCQRLEGVFAALAIRQRGQDKTQKLHTFECSELRLESKAPLQDAHGQGRQIVLASDSADGMTLYWHFTLYLDQAAVTVQLSLRNRASDEVAVDWLAPLALSDEQGGALLPDISPQNRRFLCNGFQSWSPAFVLGSDEVAIRPVDEKALLLGHNPAWALDDLPRDAGHFVSEWLSVISDPDGRRAMTAGFISSAEQFSHLECAWGQESKIRFWQARSMVDGLFLSPGKVLSSEKLMVDLHSNPLEGLATWARMTQTEMGVDPGVERIKIPLGWCSWYRYFREVDEQAVLENLGYFAEHRGHYPLDYFQIDDGYEAAIGDWLEVNADRFPHGMKWLADHIRTAGFKPGLWLAPFLVQKSSKLFSQHHDWLIKDRDGNPVSAGWNWDDELYGLDPTHPDVQDWLRSLVTTVTQEWGYRFLKLDFLYSAALPGRFYDKNATRAQAYRLGLATIRQAAGDAFILASGAPLGPSVGLVDAMRIGPDVHTEWEHKEKSAPGTENAIRNIFARYFTHRRLWLNDPDVPIVRAADTFLTRQEVLSLSTVIALSGGLLALGDNLAELPATRRQLIERLIPPYGRAAVPRDLFSPGRPQLLDLEVQTAFDNWHVVGVFNWAQEESDVRLDFAMLGLDPKQRYHVYDFWQEVYLGRFDDGLTLLQVPANGCKLLSIRRVREEPFLLSSHVHFAQGAIEVANVNYNGESQELQVHLNDLGRRHGTLLFYFPENLQRLEIKATSAAAGTWEKVDRHILAIKVSFDAREKQPQEWTMYEKIHAAKEREEPEKLRHAAIVVSVNPASDTRGRADAPDV